MAPTKKPATIQPIMVPISMIVPKEILRSVRFGTPPGVLAEKAISLSNTNKSKRDAICVKRSKKQGIDCRYSWWSRSAEPPAKPRCRPRR